MTEKAVPAGVIGVGRMGAHHARVYKELQGVDLVGVVDRDETRAIEVAEHHGTRAVERDELLERVEALSIAVPTRHHYAVANEAIERGVHVLVEKPFVETVAQGRDLIALARQNDVVLQVGHTERFNPAIAALEDVLPELDVIAVDARRLGPPVDRDVDTSVALDLMIHDIDVVLSVVDDEVAAVEAMGARDNRYISANLRFAGGVVGSLRASRVTQQKVRKLSITASQCQVNVDYIDRSVRIHRHSLPEYIETNGDVRYRHESIIERPTVENGEPLKNQLAAFVEAARSGDPPAVTGHDGLRALTLAKKIDAAAGRREAASGVIPHDPP